MVLRMKSLICMKGIMYNILGPNKKRLQPEASLVLFDFTLNLYSVRSEKKRHFNYIDQEKEICVNKSEIKKTRTIPYNIFLCAKTLSFNLSFFFFFKS